MQCGSVNDSGSQVMTNKLMTIHFTKKSLTEVYVLPSIMLDEDSWTNESTPFLSLDILTGSTNDLKCTCYNGIYQDKWPNRCMLMLQSCIPTASSSLEWVSKSEMLLPPNVGCERQCHKQSFVIIMVKCLIKNLLARWKYVPNYSSKQVESYSHFEDVLHQNGVSTVRSQVRLVC